MLEKKKNEGDVQKDVAEDEEAKTGVKQRKGKDEKVPFTDTEAEETLAKWMERQNRPYSVQDMLNNF